MHLRKPLASAVLGAALVVGSLMTPAAQAAEKPEGGDKAGAKACSTVSASSKAGSGSVSGVRTALAKDVSPKDDVPECPPGRGWRYVGEYYWASTCTNTGNGGINTGAWRQYQCTCGGAFSDYELWVR
ncbi:hypothetical protein [Streptomyces sporangiiformans]|uniref:Uncharacterized protein n=1 Tax=Streptomyces sporangiiformans TaxID=2315329 RepID=A0A505D409_9ACTN|nr:hypothetical protein [Streptomyces sporangiiformans]TPQ18414.1 hypothetical protein FGD71_031185 [Streptomyces sporangiiformans]